MPTRSSDTTWREFIGPHGYFRVEVPTHWQVQQSVASFTSGQQGRSWDGQRYLIRLTPPPSEETNWDLWMSIQVQQFADTPPPITKDGPEPSGANFIRTYHVAQDEEWLSWTVGHVRMHINFNIAAVRGSSYRPASWEPPPLLTPAERRDRLALMQRVIDSLEVPPPATQGENLP